MDCFVHAEVQLVVYYDSISPADGIRPRVIGTSKATCFLCQLCIKEHGSYFAHKSMRNCSINGRSQTQSTCFRTIAINIAALFRGWMLRFVDSRNSNIQGGAFPRRAGRICRVHTLSLHRHQVLTLYRMRLKSAQEAWSL